MERLVKVGINAKGGFNYQVVLDSYEDIKVLIKLYKELEKEGLIPRNNILKDEEDKINVSR